MELETLLYREQNGVADQLANDAMDQARIAQKSGGASPATAQSLIVVCENGLLRPIGPSPALEEGAEYEVRLRKQR